MMPSSPSLPVAGAMPAPPSADWSPTPSGLHQMLELFVDPSSSMAYAGQASHHAYVFTQLGILSSHPEYTRYLTYILVSLPQHAGDLAQWFPTVGGGAIVMSPLVAATAAASQVDSARSRAGLELKNRIKDSWTTIDAPTREYVKSACLTILRDPSSFLRSIGGTIATTVLKRGGLECWPGVLSHLSSLLDSGDAASVDGGFNALIKICEDMPRELDKEAAGRPLNYLMPKFIAFFNHPSRDIRKYAISTVNVFLIHMPHALLINMDLYMNNLFTLAGSDTSPEIRQRVCQAFVLLLEMRFTAIAAQIEPVIQFMLAASNDDDNQVCLEACEFWTAYAESAHRDATLLGKYLTHLLPILIKNMRYSQMELAVLGGDNDEDDQFVPDKAEDIKPRFHKSATVGELRGNNGATLNSTLGASSAPAAAAATAATSTVSAIASMGHTTSKGHVVSLSAPKRNNNDVASTNDGGNVDDADFDDDDDAVDDDDDDWRDDEVSDWPLRKCAAAALDALAHMYESDLLPILIPLLHTALSCKSAVESEEKQCWIVRESGVLALGAIADGCYDGLQSHLPNLIPYLLTNFMTDKKPLIRSITCWTLSHYVRWMVDDAHADGGSPHLHFLPFLRDLLAKLLDNNKKVQLAASSAFVPFEEEAGQLLTPYLADILRTMMTAFGRYQAKNLLILYDCIDTLCEAVHDDLNKPELIQILMPPLMLKWHHLADNDRNLLPLLECLNVVSQAVGVGFFVLAEPVFVRCLRIIDNVLTEQKAAFRRQADNVCHAVDMPEKEFIVCALDLLNGLAEGLEDQIEGIVSKHQSTLLRLLFECMQDLDPDVRQSAFALLGDLSKSCMGHLRPHLALLIPVCAANLNPAYKSVCNNAMWSIGEIAAKAGSQAIQPFVSEILRFLTPIILSSDDETAVRSLNENASITLGRLAYVCPSIVAPSLDTLAYCWLGILATLKDNREKDHAFSGLSLVIQTNPTAVWRSGSMPRLAAAIDSWVEPSTDMANMCHTLLTSYKSSLGAQWAPCVEQWEPNVKISIFNKYRL